MIFVSSINRLAKTTLVGWEKGTCGGKACWWGESKLVGGKQVGGGGESGKFSSVGGFPPSPPTRENPERGERF